MTTAEPVLEAWGRAMTGLQQGDESLLLEIYAEDLEFYDMFYGTMRGGRTVAETLATLAGKDFDSIDVEVRSSAAQGGTGSVEWRQVMHTGGRELRLEGVTVLTVEGGRIKRWCDYIQPLKNRKP